MNTPHPVTELLSAEALEMAQVGLWDWACASGTFRMLYPLAGLPENLASQMPPGLYPFESLCARAEQAALRAGIRAVLEGQRTAFQQTLNLEPADSPPLCVEVRLRAAAHAPGSPPERLVGTLRNVERQRLADGELRLAQRRIATLESALGGCSLVISVEACSVTLSERARHLLQLGPLDSVIDLEALLSMVDQAGRSRLREQLRVLPEDGGRAECTLEFRLPSGQQVPVACLLEADSPGGSPLVLAVLREAIDRPAEAVDRVSLDEQGMFAAINMTTSPVWLFDAADLSGVTGNDAAAASVELPGEALAGFRLEQLFPFDAEDIRRRLGGPGGKQVLVGRWRQLSRSAHLLETDCAFARLHYRGTECVLLVSRPPAAAEGERVPPPDGALIRAILDSAMDGIVVIDDQQRVVAFNRAAEDMFGHPATQVIGGPLDRLIPSAARHHHRDLVRQYVNHQRTRRQHGEFAEVVATRADGSAFRIEAALSKVASTDRRLYAVTLRDVTARRQQDDERLRQDNRARRIIRSETLSQIAGSLAPLLSRHEATLADQLERLCAEGADEREREDAVATLRASAGQIRQLAEQLSGLARPGVREHGQVHTTDLLQVALAQARSTLHAGMTLRTELAEDLPDIDFDPDRLRLLVFELFTFMVRGLDGQDATLTARCFTHSADRAEADRLGLQAEGEHIAILLTADAPLRPIPGEQDVFDPLFAATDRRGSRILGLGIVKQIAQRPGGNAHLSIDAAGAPTLVAYLPVPRQAAPRAPFSRAKLVIGRGERILFVDDERFLAQPAELLLSRMGFNVQAMTDPEQALSLIEGGPTDFSALVTDLYMPKVSGLDLIAAVRRTAPDLPIILCSGFMTEAQRAEASSLGVNNFVLKPYTGEELARALERLLHSS